jgi:hypothetical protein
MLIHRINTINTVIDAGNSYADLIEKLQGESDKADVYREAFAHVVGLLQLAPSHNVMLEADLEHCGAFGDLGRCGGCKNTIGSLNFIYDCNFIYCPFCGSKLNKEVG